MALRLIGHIDLPEHRGAGGFDHADIHSPSDRPDVARTGNGPPSKSCSRSAPTRTEARS